MTVPGISILAALIVGFIYTIQAKELLSPKKRLHTTIIYIIAQLIMGALNVIFTMEVTHLFISLGTLFIVNLVYALLKYWVLSLGGQIYLMFK